MANSESRPYLIVIGSSAGGIDALSVLVSTLPADFSAPIVVAQHLDPSRPSHLDEILARRTKMSVRMLLDGSQPLQQGSIYVVPANRNVRIDDTAITVSLDGAGQIKPSVDLLMTSASESFGERLIAIILSGTGSDGAAGARVVKRAGGTVIIQNPDTAPFPGMPLSLAPNIVDIVADVDRIGPILQDLLAGVEVPTQPKERRELEHFLEDVRTRLDIDFKSYKMPTIMRRLQRRIVATETEDLTGYITYLAAYPEEYQQLANAFLIKVTDFFRDPDLFEYLRGTVLPELIEYGRKHGNDVRIWSAGCATGEEAYSLAILVAELLGGALDHCNIRIFATDIDADAIAYARRGVYPASALSTMPQDLIDRYFTKEDDNYQIRKRVRSLTVFGQHDLAQRAPFPRVDLVICRNVLIYFTPELQQRTLQLFAYALRDGGYLVLGKAESSGALAEVFAPADRVQKVYRRHGDRFLMPPGRVRPAAPAVPHRLGFTHQPSGAIVPRALDKPISATRTSPESLLLRLPVGIVVVNRQYDIQTINGPARQYFAIHSPAIGDDLIHLAQGIPHASLRTAIDAAFRTGAQQVIDEFAVEAVTTGKPRYLQVLCYPQRAAGDHEPVEAVLIAAHDISRYVESRQLLEQQVATASGEMRQLRQETQSELAARDQMVGRLVETNRQLLEANQDLTSANEELRTTNEELLLAAEEAQAATEEVETLNEELQATNEELETLNEELQATIEELNTTNDDLHARSVELQNLAHTSDEERARLGAILANMADGVVVVDGEAQPLVTNAAYDQMIGGPSAPFVPLDENGEPLPAEQAPLQRAARGEVFSMEFVAAAPDGSRRWYEANGQPVRNHESGAQAVVVIRDTTERSLRRLQDEFIARASHELRTPLTPIQTYLQQVLRHLPQTKDNETTRGYAESALAQTKRLARLVKDMVEATRLQMGKYTLNPQPMRLDELLTETVDVARLLGGKQTIHLAITKAPVTISGDADRLEQVILNLLTNAIKYAPNTDRIEVRLTRNAAHAELIVQDHGTGIAPSALANIFQRYYQVERSPDAPLQGLGLGLYITREIIVAHGGTITVESQPGKGSIFTLNLPLLDVKDASSDGGKPQGKPQKEPK